MSDDDKLRDMLRSEIPASKPGYWSEISARLDRIEAESDTGAGNAAGSPVGPVEPRAPETVVPETRAPETPADDNLVHLFDRSSPTTRRRSRYLVTLAAAAVVAVAAVGVVAALNRNGSLTEVGPAEPTEDGSTAIVDDEPSDDDGRNAAADDAGDDGVSDDGASTDAGTETTVPTTTESSDDKVSDNTESDDTESEADTDPEPGADPDTAPDAEFTSDAEPGLRYDYGELVQDFEDGGTRWIRFDRSAFGPDQAQGTDHTTEPDAALASDFHGGQNLNPRLRTYPLAADLTVLLIDPDIYIAACNGDPVGDDIHLPDADLDLLLSYNVRVVTLTFNDSGEVTRIRDQRGC